MTDKEAKIEALTALWSWASILHEGHEEGELSITLFDKMRTGEYTMTEAFLIQSFMVIESQRILDRIQKLKTNENRK